MCNRLDYMQLIVYKQYHPSVVGEIIFLTVG